MICSMTGYAALMKETTHGTLTLELRTVNNRYLDVQFRLPGDFKKQELAIREQLTAQLSRGKVECRLDFSARISADSPEHINSSLLEKLQQLNRTIQSTIPGAQSLTVADVLQWPGILRDNNLPIDALHALHEANMALLQQALADLIATRAREGEKLKKILQKRSLQMRQLLTDIAPRIPNLISVFEERLRVRLKEAIGNLDEDRIRQEISLFAVKIDIDEELSRLRTHMDEVDRILDKGGVVGRRLDFMMQELNREVNTIGSKSVDLEISKTSVALKVLIEQMREQVQNIE